MTLCPRSPHEARACVVHCVYSAGTWTETEIRDRRAARVAYSEQVDDVEVESTLILADILPLPVKSRTNFD